MSVVIATATASGSYAQTFCRLDLRREREHKISCLSALLLWAPAAAAAVGARTPEDLISKLQREEEGKRRKTKIQNDFFSWNRDFGRDRVRGHAWCCPSEVRSEKGFKKNIPVFF